jgi:hypothetical protein
MSDDIFNSAKKFAAQFAGFHQAAQLWDGIESIEQAASVAKNRLAAAQLEHNAWLEQTEKVKESKLAEISALDARIAQTKKDMAEHVDGRKREGEAIVERARVLMTEAHRKADAAVSDGQQQAAAIIAEATNAASAHQARLQELAAKVAASQRALDEANTKVLDAGKREAAIEAHIAKLKAM